MIPDSKYAMQDLGVNLSSLMFADETDRDVFEKILVALLNRFEPEVYEINLYILNQEGSALSEEVFIRNRELHQGNDILPLSQIPFNLGTSSLPVQICDSINNQIWLPVKQKDRGFLGLLIFRSVAKFSDETLEGLRLLGISFAFGIKHVLSLRSAQRSKQLVGIINKMSRELQSLVGSQYLLKRFVNMAVEQLGFDRATLFLFHEGRKDVQYCICSYIGHTAFEVRQIPDIPLMVETPRFLDQIQGVLLPLKAGSRHLGALLVDNLMTLDTIPHDSIDILMDLCGQVALSCENLILFDRLKQMAIRDDLTKLYRRGYFYEQAESEIVKNNNVALLTIDMDFFKHINDTYGHMSGDDVLVQAADLIRACLRAEDLACRMGGDEFLVLLCGSSTEYCVDIALRLLNNFAQHRFKISDDIYINLSISIGVALYPEHADNLHDLFLKSDEALYTSKREGRGRVTIASE